MADRFRILVASDGSPSASAAIDTALAFPWPLASRARGVVALRESGILGVATRGALAAGLRTHAELFQRTLAQRWPGADVATPNEAPASAVLGAARRFEADAIVLGWRGHGAFTRLLAGSVSRAVAEAAPCPVLVARTAPKAIRRMVVGLDGTANSRRAVRLLEKLHPPRGNRIFLVHVLTPIALMALGRVPAQTRAMVREEVARVNAANRRRAQKRLDAAAASLMRRGWHVTRMLRAGDPPGLLLQLVRERNADVLVVGATGKSGLVRAMLGSVAVGALNHSPVPVLIAR